MIKIPKTSPCYLINSPSEESPQPSPKCCLLKTLPWKPLGSLGYLLSMSCPISLFGALQVNAVLSPHPVSVDWLCCMVGEWTQVWFSSTLWFLLFPLFSPSLSSSPLLTSSSFSHLFLLLKLIIVTELCRCSVYMWKVNSCISGCKASITGTYPGDKQLTLLLDQDTS